MSAKMKNISQAEVLVLKEQIAYQEGQVVSKTLAQNNALSITLFSFATLTVFSPFPTFLTVRLTSG